MTEKESMRVNLLSLTEKIEDAGLTTLFISERPEGEEKISLYGFESYILAGVIILTIHPALDARKLEIRKMRGTEHTLRTMDFEFTKKGIEIIGETKGGKTSKKSIF